jgi:hypothetical protein
MFSAAMTAVGLLETGVSLPNSECSEPAILEVLRGEVNQANEMGIDEPFITYVVENYTAFHV